MAKNNDKIKLQDLPLLEKDIMNQCCQWLHNSGVFFWRSNNIPVFGRNNGGAMTHRSMPKFSIKGVPDIILVHEGMFIAIEVKRPKAKLRPDQEIFMEKTIKAGAHYHVVHSLDELIAVMHRYLTQYM